MRLSEDTSTPSHIIYETPEKCEPWKKVFW
jgi:hypothetical protein